MIRQVTVVVMNGKENTQDEDMVSYPVEIPNDILFYTKNGIRYAGWWDTSIPPRLIEVPVNQILSID